jgi:hypothetical protein
LVPYLSTQVLLNMLPFRSDLWPLYAALVFVSGIYSGLFFARLGAVIRPVRWLFFVENNGFLLGIAACSVLYLLLGRLSLWIIPVILAVLCWIYTPAPNEMHVQNTSALEGIQRE